MSNRTYYSTILFSVSALTLSVYNFVQAPSKKPVPIEAEVFQSTSNEKSISDNAATVIELNEHIARLEQRIFELEQQALESPAVSSGNHPDLKQLVLNVIEQKEAQEREEMRNQDPAYAFYESLPQDYEIKLKTDPEYAEQVNKSLSAKVLNSGLPAVERLSAMGQLQMNMYVLNKTQMSHYNYDTVDAILKIAQHSSDEKIKVQALEVITNTPLADARIADSFVSIMEKEQNEYVRSMAADGLMLQYYQSKSAKSDLHRQLAQQILSVYNNADQKLKDLLKNNTFNDDVLAELTQNAGN